VISITEVEVVTSIKQIGQKLTSVSPSCLACYMYWVH